MRNGMNRKREAILYTILLHQLANVGFHRVPFDA